LTDLLQNHKPGEQVELLYNHRNEQKKAMITLGENPAFTVVLNENMGKVLTEEQKDFRKSWLETKSAGNHLTK
jgi:hypothetical protein